MTAEQVAQTQALSRELDDRIPRLDPAAFWGQALILELERALFHEKRHTGGEC